jgi:CHAD domain-containing protein
MLFAAGYPPQRLKKARKQVRRVRQAARQVRDLDVLLDRIHSSSDGAEDLSPLTAELRVRRDDAMHELDRTLRKRRRRRLQSRFAPLLTGDGARQPSTGDAQQDQSVGTLLCPCIDAFEAAAAADLSDTAALHSFRLHGKRLRYTLELLSSGETADAADVLIRVLKDLQQRLGDINDHASASGILASIADETGDADVRRQAQQLARSEQDRLEQGKAGFLDAWTTGVAAQTHAALEGVRSRLAPADPGGNERAAAG